MHLAKRCTAAKKDSTEWRGNFEANLLVGSVWSATDVQVTQVTQRGPILIIHAAGEVGVIQVLIARRFRHVLQHAETLRNSFLPLRRKISPGGQHFIFYVLPLLGRHLLPNPTAITHFLLLLR